jgi:hypothetical protein
LTITLSGTPDHYYRMAQMQLDKRQRSTERESPSSHEHDNFGAASREEEEFEKDRLTFVKVRATCLEANAVLSGLSDSDPATRQAVVAQYEKLRNEMIAMALAIKTDLHRDSAIKELIGVSYRARDLKSARLLFDRLHDKIVRELVLKECPELLVPKDQPPTVNAKAQPYLDFRMWWP